MTDVNLKEAMQLYRRELILGEEFMIESIEEADPSDTMIEIYYLILGDFIQERLYLQTLWPYSHYDLTEIIIKYPWSRALTKNCSIV